MYTLSIIGHKSFAHPEFLPGFLGALGLLIFSLVFFWLIGLPLKNKKRNRFNNYPLDVLNMKPSKYVMQALPLESSEKQLSRTKRYMIYGLSLTLCFIPMSELLAPLFY